MSWMKDLLTNEQGFALLLALFVVATVMILGMSIMTISMISSESSGQQSISQKNFQIADGAAEIGRDWLLDKVDPPENDSQYNNSPPWDAFTAFSSDMNPTDPETGQPYPFPQYHYKIEDYGVPAAKTAGETLTGGRIHDKTKRVWHYYKVIAESRSGQAAHDGQFNIDKRIVMLNRRLYLE